MDIADKVPQAPDTDGWRSALDDLLRFIARGTQRLASFSVLAMLTIAGLTIVDAALRSTGRGAIPGLNETVGLLLGIGMSSCLPAGLARKGSLRIDIIRWSRWPRAAAMLEAVSATLLLIFIGLLAWQMGVVAADEAEQGLTTMLSGWKTAPFVWTIATMFGLAACVQALVAVRECLQMREALPTAWTAAVAIALLCTLVAGALLTGKMAMPSGVAAWFSTMSPPVMAALWLGVLWVGIIIGLPVGAVMGMAGLLGTAALLGLEPALSVIGSEARKYLTSETLAVLPLFMLMGALASVAGLAEDIYRLANGLLGHLRGGLAYGTMVGCTAFGALTGSSLACAVTIGRASMPEMRKRGYDAGFAAGTVAAGGTLGQVVPPSSALIVYALLTEESVGKLFQGTIGVAVLSLALYLVTIWIYTRFRPAAAPSGERIPRAELRVLFKRSLSVLALFAAILGGMYSGIFTVSEAASVGVLGTFGFAVARGKLKGAAIWSVTAETTAAIAMVLALILGATTFSFFVGAVQLPDSFITLLNSLHLTPLSVVIVLCLTYLLLGMVMDAFAMMLFTAPIFAPLVISLGYDGVWWGLITVVLVEAGMIAPPFGLNLMVLKSVDPTLRMNQVYRGVMPYWLADVVRVVILIALPQVVLWLPRHLST